MGVAALFAIRWQHNGRSVYLIRALIPNCRLGRARGHKLSPILLYKQTMLLYRHTMLLRKVGDEPLFFFFLRASISIQQLPHGLANCMSDSSIALLEHPPRAACLPAPASASKRARLFQKPRARSNFFFHSYLFPPDLIAGAPSPLQASHAGGQAATHGTPGKRPLRADRRHA